MISITAFGRVPLGRMVRRTGAKAGDGVVVTGTIGDAALGLEVLKRGAAAAALADDAAAGEMLVGRYRVPQPRTALAQSGARSRQRRDGCIGRPGRRPRQAVRGIGGIRCDRSREHPAVGCCRDAACAGRVGVEAIVSGGDDYEILCAIPPAALEAFRHAAQTAGVAISAIGKIVAGSSAPRFLDKRVTGSACRGCPTAISSIFEAQSSVPCANAVPVVPSGRPASMQQMVNPTQKPFLRATKTPLRPFRDVAPGKRFWHGPARFEAAPLGRVGLLFMRPPRPAVMA